MVESRSSACNSIEGESFQVGQLVQHGNHWGPRSHNLDDFSCEEVMPLVSKSAGLSSIGQNPSNRMFALTQVPPDDTAATAVFSKQMPLLAT